MSRDIIGKAFVLSIIFLFIGVAFIPSFNAVSIDEETLSIKTEPINYPTFAFLFGRIKNRHTDEHAENFDAVNLYIMSLIPFGLYHLNSGEEVYISAVAPDHYVIVGFLTDNFIIGLCMNANW
jgi:hypothetical protein